MKFTMTIDADLPKGKELVLLLDWLEMVRSKIEDCEIDGLTKLELAGSFTYRERDGDKIGDTEFKAGSFSLETELGG